MNPFTDNSRSLRPAEINRDGLVSPIDSPKSPPRRSTHRKASSGSITFADQIPLTKTPCPRLNAFEFENLQSPSQGLGISGRALSIPRVPVGARSPLSPPSSSSPFFSNSSTAVPSPYTPGSSTPLLSPLQRSATETGSYAFDGGGLPTMHEDEQDISTGKNTLYEDRFLKGVGSADAQSAESRDSRFNAQNEDENGREVDKLECLDGCPSKRDIHASRKHWLSVSIIILSIYSTVLSGIYLVVAIMQPRYGRTIQSGGKLTPETASVLFALFAKTIELSFVSVFVAFLGQVLSRRSLVKTSRGVTIAELTMRTWVIQPAFMITHWETLRHAGLSILGAITLTNAFVAMIYTTASDSLVSPHLKYGDWVDQTMYGTVKASYANPTYVASLCHNPTADLDPVYAGTSCLAVLHAGQAHSNHITFLSNWTDINKGGEGILDENLRPQAPAMLFDNTTVIGTWVSKEWSNMTASYANYKRIVNNVTMAMPHAGVFDAARDKKNGILQPENLAGVGEYKIRASVVSPTINVLCVNMDETEMGPLIYTNWPNASVTVGEQLPRQRLPKPSYDYTQDIHPSPGETYLNSTTVDDIFEWGPKYQRQPPVFPMYPIEYNSVINVTVPMVGNGDSIYVLFKAPNTITTDYTLCKLRSVISPNCSTHYAVSGTTGGEMKSVCEDDADDMSYLASVPDAPTVPKADWMNVGSELMRALALGSGISNGNASSSRLISQLVTKMPASGPPKLNPLMPSIAESLAVMAGSTLLLSITDSSFYHFWNYTENIILEGTQLPFNASIQSQQYASGYIQKWTTMFYLVLIIVFVTNVFCLVYFFIRSGLVTDYSEPQNLFALAINSPSSRRLYGSCGAGPEGNQFNVDWHVSQEEESGHFFIKEGDRGLFRRRRSVFSRNPPLDSATSYSRLSTKRRSWL